MFFRDCMELPESNLIRKTFTVREMDLPPEIQLTKKSLLRWFALASGLISEKESRTTVLDILDALFVLNLGQKIEPTTLEIQKFIKDKTGKAVGEKLIRYHLKRLLDINFLRRKKNKFYSFNNSPESHARDLKASYNYWVTQATKKSMDNTERVLDLLSKQYSSANQ